METPGRHQQLLLGIDVGTQSLRAVLFDLQGRAVASGVAPIETTYPRPTWAEQQPLAWWSAAVEAVRLALSQGNITGEQVAGIGIDCTACTVVATAMNGEPLRPALLWMDQRAFQEAEIISATGDPVLRFVSGRVSPEWMLPKALWLKRNEPAVYARAERIVECTDWMMHRLTGEWTLSLNHVAVKWNYARPDGGWPVRLLDGVGLSDLLDKWPERIVPLGRGEARLSGRAAQELGLRAGTPVAQGGIYVYLGMLGMGATYDGDVAVIVGSSTCHLRRSREGVFGSGAAGCYPDATVEGLYTLEAGQTATGSILDWYRRHFAGNQQAEAERRGVPVFQVLDELAAAVPPAAEGLIVRDDWQGNRSPYKNPMARVALPGCPWRTDRAMWYEGFMKQPPAAPGTSFRMPPPMACVSNGFSWEEAELDRRCGCKSTPTCSRNRFTLHAKRNRVRWARPWPRHLPPGCIKTFTKQPKPWLPLRRRSSPIWRMPSLMMNCSHAMCRCIRG